MSFRIVQDCSIIFPNKCNTEFNLEFDALKQKLAKT